MRTRRRKLAGAVLVALCLPGGRGALAQQTCQARMEQDPARDNLVHARDYSTAEPGTLGRVLREGQGPLDMVLVAGAGFGAEVFEGFMRAKGDRYRMLAVTLPGFGGTPAPPMPAPGTSYAERTWTLAASAAVAQLIEQEGLDRPVVVGHWLSGAQVALDLALDRPDLVRAAIAISGVPKFVPTSGSGMQEPGSPALRARMVDRYLAPQWFKTVTPETWHDNNFLPRDYAIHPLRALQLWRSAAEPPLPVWIRYLCEAWAHDGTARLAELEVPLLILEPDFDALYAEGPQTGEYMKAFLHEGWRGVEGRSDRITVETISDSRVFIMDDQPERLNEAIERFLVGPGARARRPAPPTSATTEAEKPSDLPDYWKGSVENRGDRFMLRDARLAVERPDATWTLETLTDEPPVVATLEPADRDSRVTIQIHPVLGMTLEALAPLIENSILARYPTYRRQSLEPADLAGRTGYRLDATWEQDGQPTRSFLLFVKLDEDHVLSIGFRAAEARFETVRPQFDRIAASVTVLE